MNTSRKGNSAENYVRKDLEAKGFIVGSRRHIEGPGDWIAVHPNGAVWLVEAKGCKDLWQNFRREDREQMIAMKLPRGGERWVANVTGSGAKREIDWRPELGWPSCS